MQLQKQSYFRKLSSSKMLFLKDKKARINIRLRTTKIHLENHATMASANYCSLLKWGWIVTYSYGTAVDVFEYYWCLHANGCVLFSKLLTEIFRKVNSIKQSEYQSASPNSALKAIELQCVVWLTVYLKFIWMLEGAAGSHLIYLRDNNANQFSWQLRYVWWKQR